MLGPTASNASGADEFAMHFMNGSFCIFFVSERHKSVSLRSSCAVIPHHTSISVSACIRAMGDVYAYEQFPIALNAARSAASVTS